MWQLVIERSRQRPRINRAIERAGRNLPQRVDARVGASGTGYRHVAVVEFPQRVFEKTLDGNAGRLPLPADVVGAVVGEGQFEGGH